MINYGISEYLSEYNYIYKPYGETNTSLGWGTICDRPRQNQPYCAGPQSEIRVKIVAQGEY